MKKNQLIKDLTHRFENQKTDFLYDVKNSVSRYIAAQGANCLTIVEKNNANTVAVWNISPNPAYALRLIAFCRGKQYNGNNLDSGLTKPVINIVSKKFEQLYEKNDEKIAKAILEYMLQDEVIQKSLVDTIINSATSKQITDQVKSKAATLILSQIKEALQVALAKGSLLGVGKAVGAIAAKPIAAKIAALLVKFILLHLKTVIAKVLASAAIKTLIATAVKKFLLAALVGAIVKFIAAKFGISASAAFMWILIPVIVGYVAYEIWTFPKHLGEKVGDKIYDDLSDKYSQINEDVFTKIVTEVLDVGLTTILENIAQSDEVQNAIGDLIAELA